jgi:hypothetical protein
VLTDYHDVVGPTASEPAGSRTRRRGESDAVNTSVGGSAEAPPAKKGKTAAPATQKKTVAKKLQKKKASSMSH